MGRKRDRDVTDVPASVPAVPAVPGARKVAIREAALTLFAERGYYGTGMEDIAGVVGLRASSLYNHVSSKQELLADIMLATMTELMEQFHAALVLDGSAPDARTQLRRAMEAHVRYHGTHRRDVRIGNREIPSLDEPARTEVRRLRRDYARGWQGLIESGVSAGEFQTLSPQLAAYALLEMGIGVSQWYREGGPLSLDEIAFHYGEMALRQVGG